MGQGTNVAIICHYGSVCYEYLCIRGTKWIFTFPIGFLRDPPDLTSLSFPKIDTIPVNHREYYNLLLARAQLIGRLLLEWRTKQALEYKNRAKPQCCK